MHFVLGQLEKVRTGTNRTYSDDEDDSEDDMMDTMVVPGRAGPPAAPPLPVAAAPGASASAGAVESDGKDAKKKKKFKLSASQVTILGMMRRSGIPHSLRKHGTHVDLRSENFSRTHIVSRLSRSGVVAGAA